MRMRSIVVIASICLGIAACSAGGEDWTIAVGKYTLMGPPPEGAVERAPEQASCDSLDGAMCARDGSMLCSGNVEGVNAPAMCPAPGK